MTTWECGCGATGTGETAAQRHVKDGCTLMGMPHGRTVEDVLGSRYWLTEKGEAAAAAYNTTKEGL